MCGGEKKLNFSLRTLATVPTMQLRTALYRDCCPQLDEDWLLKHIPLYAELLTTEKHASVCVDQHGQHWRGASIGHLPLKGQVVQCLILTLSDCVFSVAIDKMGFMQRYSLKTSDNQRTKAAELTLRQSLYPLALVTTLFFLWV